MNRKSVQPLVILLAALLLIGACKKKTKTEIVEIPSTPGRPAVTTVGVDSLSSSSVVLSGQVTREGNGDVSGVGFCWSDETLPVIDDTPTNYQFPASHFKYRLTGLKPGTTYNFRAFATNEKGTGYGETVTFQTLQGWKKLEQPQNTPIRQFSSLISTGTKLVGISSGGIFVSSDNGLTWSTSSNNLMGNINSLSNIGEILFATSSNGVFVSSNGGVTWIPSTSGLNGDPIDYLYAHDNYMFAGTSNFLFRSTNNGQLWTPVTFSINFSYMRGLASQGNSLILFSDNYIFQSEDNGSNWISSPNQNNPYFNELQGTPTNLIKIISQQVYVSSDKGKTWTLLNLPGYFSQVVTSGNNAVIFGNGASGVYLSSDGGNSWLRNDGGFDAYPTSCVFHKNYLLASTYNGMYKLVLN